MDALGIIPNCTGLLLGAQLNRTKAGGGDASIHQNFVVVSFVCGAGAHCAGVPSALQTFKNSPLEDKETSWEHVKGILNKSRIVISTTQTTSSCLLGCYAVWLL
jgi:hypothetical protein